MRRFLVKIDPNFLQILLETVLLVALVVIPASVYLKISLIFVISLAYFLYIRRFGDFNSRYADGLRKELSARDEIIAKQREILTETKENYETLQKKLKKALIAIQLRDLKDKHRGE